MPTETGAKVESDQHLLTEEEREKILDRTHSLFVWAGHFVPEKEILDGIEVDLRNLVYILRTKKGITEEDREMAHALIRKLGERKRELEARLAHDQITLKLANDLLDEIGGIVKAISALHDVEFSDQLEADKQAIIDRIEDERRWLHYLEKIKMATKL